MKKNIETKHDLMVWVESILLDEEFEAKVSCPKVSFGFSTMFFIICGDLSVSYFSIKDIPSVLRDADNLEFFADKDMLRFRAYYCVD